MVTNKILKDLGFSDIEDYFNYILISHINGNFTQVSELIEELSNNQKIEAIDFFKSEGMAKNDDYPNCRAVLKMLIETLKDEK